jgi:aspartate racemase
MEQDFYKARLEARGIHVRIPEGSDIALVNGVIFDELCQGIVSDASKAEYLRIIDSLSQKGAGGVILGCTEIGMLVSQKDTSVPLFDTTLIHARRAALYALGQG